MSRASAEGRGLQWIDLGVRRFQYNAMQCDICSTLKYTTTSTNQSLLEAQVAIILPGQSLCGESVIMHI